MRRGKSWDRAIGVDRCPFLWTLTYMKKNTHLELSSSVSRISAPIAPPMTKVGTTGGRMKPGGSGEPPAKPIWVGLVVAVVSGQVLTRWSI